MPVLVRDLPSGFAALTELALDLRRTWSHQADALWEQVDAEAWNRTPEPLDHSAGDSSGAAECARRGRIVRRQG
jgi:hypothetical protein